MMRALQISTALATLALFLGGCQPTTPGGDTAAAEDVPQGAPLYSPEPEPEAEEPKPAAAGLEGAVVAAKDKVQIPAATGGSIADIMAREAAREARSAEANPDLLTFRFLSNFKYVEPEAGKPDTLDKDQIPAAIRALNGQSVIMEGYMIPIDLDADTNRVKTFFLSRNTMACCFGQLPEVNEVVEVRFEEGVKFLPDILLRVEGKFEVGEEFDEYGYLMSIFRMQGTKLEDPWDK